MAIHLYTRCWNDAEMLPYFFKHYDTWVDRYFVYDDGSTDASLAILKAHPRVAVHHHPPMADPDSRIESQRQLQNQIWKQSRGEADWIVVTDIDEHLFHRDILEYLRKCRNNGVTVVPALGFQMISDTFQPYSDLPASAQYRMGVAFGACSKANIFDPNAICETNFTVGLHGASFEGHVLAPANDEVLLLHFHYLGFERVKARHKRWLSRQRPKDLEQKWGIHYSWSDAELRDKWDAYARAAIEVLRSEPNDQHPGRHVWAGLPRIKLRRPLSSRLFRLAQTLKG